MTKLELFKNCINFINGEPTNIKVWKQGEGKYELEEVSPADLIEGLNHEIELLQRKAATPRKPSATQLENETFKTAIVNYLTCVDMPKTIKEMQSEIDGFAELSNQRISHLLTDLRRAGIVARTYVKKVAYFALGKEEEVEA